MTPVLIGKKAFFWRVVSPKNRGQTSCRIVHIFIFIYIYILYNILVLIIYIDQQTNNLCPQKAL